MKKVNRIKLISLLMLLLLPGALRATEKKGDVWLETRVSADRLSRGENITYEVVLFTANPRIEGIELSAYPEFFGAEVSRSAPDTQLSPVEIDGRKYFTAVVDRYFLRFPDAGKFRLKGGNYNLGISHPQEYYDPFWGRSVGNAVETLPLIAGDKNVRVVELPSKGRPADFSGAVGQFELGADVPPGELRNGEDFLLTVTISGLGSLAGMALPDIPAMLPDGLQFKSLTDNISHFVKDGELGSEVEIECMIMPKREGEFEIDRLTFSFFNNRTGKYETVKAPAFNIVVGSGLPGSKRPAVIMEV